MSDELVAVGRFSRMTRMSVKTLHHYHDVGLVVPAWIDPATGYRYYDRSQARLALQVSMLRRLDVPIERVRRIVTGIEPMAQALALERERVERAAARLAGLLACLDRLTDGEQLPCYSPTVVSVPDRLVAVRRASTPVELLDSRVEAEIEAMFAAVVPLGVPEDRPAIGIFPALLDDEVVFAVAVALDAAVDGPFAIELLEGGRYVEVNHVGAHAELPLAYHAVHDWLASRGLELVGPVIENYLTAPGGSSTELPTTTVMAPLAATTPE